MISFLRRTASGAFLLLFFCMYQTDAQSLNTHFAPRKGDRIILLGNTFADRMRHFGYFETLLQDAFPDRELTLRNMGWSADEVGLQPRPLNFPGFGEKTTRLTEGQKEVTFKGFTHEGEPITMPVGMNFSGLNQDLADQQADIIFLCFGMNEAFKGPAGLPQFERDLHLFVQNLQKNNYNGEAPPQLVIVSPIAHEELGGHFPDPATHNQNLEMYTRSMQQYASKNGLLFIDLFTPSLTRTKAATRPFITINGIHLTDAGYQLAAQWMAAALGFGKKADFRSEQLAMLKKVIGMKDDHFFYRWRAVNGEYIYGRRREPFGVIAFPPELRKLNQMTASLDSVIWELAKNKNPKTYQKALNIIDQRGKPLDPALATTIAMTGRQGEAAKAAAHAHHGDVNTTATDPFTLPKGYEINLFASEKDFPIEKPVAMNFDAKGRLWVATMPTYPQYFPGIPVHDKIVILEDTDHDGVADKHTVFADDLYLPLGFEFGNGGVYVSQEPDIVFLKDTDGDGKADLREVILTGFGSEDSHHATHAFTFGQDGALYFNEGTFLNSQVETPYGPVRSYAGATWRFEPRTHKLEHYISYPYYNPWGSVFDRWGVHLIGDASDGSNYFAPPMTGKVAYPDKHPRTDMFTETRVRPTAGIEIISSKNFPDAVQNDFIVNNNIGFQGTKQHHIIPDGAGIRGKEVEALLQSSDPNFRPIDLEIGPDGALYMVDWYNPLISHGENPPRDPARDRSHGRVWRISYKQKPLSGIVDVSNQSVWQLLENLKAVEDRFRYRSRAQLRDKPAQEVLPATEKWAATLDQKDPDYEHHLLEALWLFQDFDTANEKLLVRLLNAREAKARTAATRVLRFWRDRIPNSLDLLTARINDPSPATRLEAVVALSFFDSEKAVLAATDVFRYPTDRFLDYGTHETFRHLKPVWKPMLESGKLHEKAQAYLLTMLSDNEIGALPKKPSIALLLDAVSAARNNAPARQRLTNLLLKNNANALKQQHALFKKTIAADTSQYLKATSYAALLTVKQPANALPKIADATFLHALSLLPDFALKATFFEKAKSMGAQNPELTYPLLMEMTLQNPATTPPVAAYVSSLKGLPAETLHSPGFGKAVLRMKALTAFAPEKVRPEILAMLENMGTIEISLTAVEGKMAFDKTLLAIPAGRRISLIFNNPDVMPHNVVITKPGADENVGEAADAMAKLPDGFERNFVPATTDILFATPLVNAGKQFRLDFTAPAVAGDYPFICSFPGHWRAMRGILQVKK